MLEKAFTSILSKLEEDGWAQHVAVHGTWIRFIQNAFWLLCKGIIISKLVVYTAARWPEECAQQLCNILISFVTTFITILPFISIYVLNKQVLKRLIMTISEWIKSNIISDHKQRNTFKRKRKRLPSYRRWIQPKRMGKKAK
eukprot:3424912-Ditylum_brightwellii.AAC.1